MTTAVIAGSHDWLRQNAYTIKRTRPLRWTVTDDEASDEVVCHGGDHAEAVRELLRLRFSPDAIRTAAAKAREGAE